MAVTEGLKDYDRDTAGNNTPAGSDTIGQDLDNHLRSIKANIRAAADRALNAKSAAYTVTTDEINEIIDVDASATGSIVITLPNPSTMGSGAQVGVNRAIASDGTVTTGNINIVTASGKIDGTATVSLATSHVGLMFLSDGTNWRARAQLAFPALSGMTAGDAIVASDAGRIKGAGFTLENVIEQGTVAVFYQAAAPSLWTIGGSGLDDCALVFDVSNGGTSNGGSWSLTGITADNLTLTIGQIPSHSHSYTQITYDSATFTSGASSGRASQNSQGATTGNTGGSPPNPHTHTITSDGSWRPKAARVIRATKDSAVAL